MLENDIWLPLGAAAAAVARARAAELEFLRALHPEADPFGLTPRALAEAPELAGRREAFRRAHALACRLRDAAAAA